MLQDRQMKTLRALLIVLSAIGVTVGDSVLAQATNGRAATIDERVGTYEVYASTRENQESGAETMAHLKALISIVRTGRDPKTYGLSLILVRPESNGPGTLPDAPGDGFVCNDANVLPGEQALTCSRTRPTFVETALVGLSGTPFCNALRGFLVRPDGTRIEEVQEQRRIIVDENRCKTDTGGTENSTCICYDIRSKSNLPVDLLSTQSAAAVLNPPSSGSGSGRRN